MLRSVLRRAILGAQSTHTYVRFPACAVVNNTFATSHKPHNSARSSLGYLQICPLSHGVCARATMPTTASEYATHSSTHWAEQPFNLIIPPTRPELALSQTDEACYRLALSMAIWHNMFFRGE